MEEKMEKRLKLNRRQCSYLPNLLDDAPSSALWAKPALKSTKFPVLPAQARSRVYSGCNELS